MYPLANTEDPDEMPHTVAFHQGLHCFPLETKMMFRERNTILSEIITVDLSISTMDHPKFIVSYQKEVNALHPS